MLRRALPSLVPALLALAFLFGTPATSIGGPEASLGAWNIEAATTPVVRGSLTQDVADAAVNQSADQDDTPDDRVVRTITTIVWPGSSFQTRILYASHRADRPRPCAAPPRAPPTA